MNAHNGKHGRSRAFTLIELLTVVAIIGILVTLTVAVGSYIRTEANRRETQGNIDILAGAVDKFQQLYDVYPPDGTEPPYAIGDTPAARLASGQVLMRILTGNMNDNDYQVVFGKAPTKPPALDELAIANSRIQQQVTPLLQKLTAKCYSAGAGSVAPKDAWNKDMIYLKTQGASAKPVIISAGPDHYFGQSLISSEPAGSESDNVRSDSRK